MSSFTLTWVGQAGFLVEGAGTRVLVDPFLTDYEARRYPPPPLDGGLADDIDFLFATHEHLDHLDVDFLPKLAERCPQARLVLPTPIASQVDGLFPADRVQTVQPGETFRAGGLEVLVTPAWHGIELADAYTDGSQHGGGVRFVGYVFRTPETSVWHTGDTILNDELVAAVEDAGVDVALVPINGRSWEREQAGLVGNTSFREAVELARRIGASMLVPIHWDMFAGNTEWPGRAVDEAVERGCDFHVVTLARLRPFRV